MGCTCEQESWEQKKMVSSSKNELAKTWVSPQNPVAKFHIGENQELGEF
jgi:hypothetical protein